MLNEPEKSAEPNVQIIRKSLLQRLSEKETLIPLALILAILTLILTLNFFEVINIPFLDSLPKSTVRLVLKCPTPTGCNQGKIITFENSPALGYQLPEKSNVVSVTKALDSRQFIQAPYTKDSPIGLNQSFIWGDSCYTITYTVPSDSVITPIIKLPIQNSFQIIQIGSDSIKLKDQSLNLVMQLQKRPLDKSTIGKADHVRCSVNNVWPTQYGSFEPIEGNLFR